MLSSLESRRMMPGSHGTNADLELQTWVRARVRDRVRVRIRDLDGDLEL